MRRPETMQATSFALRGGLKVGASRTDVATPHMSPLPCLASTRLLTFVRNYLQAPTANAGAPN
jgi:hypothetical protein